MKKPAKLLPTEVAALVHHVELNRAGWWDKAVHRLVLAAVWLADKPPTTAEIRATMANDFHLVLSELRISAATHTLESQNALVRLPGPSFRIPDDKRAAFEAEIAEAEAVAKKARAHFAALVHEMCSELDADSTWQVFESDYLAPVIREAGANAYRLLVGERMTIDKRSVQRFLERFEAKFHSTLPELVARFLDPQKIEVRTYVSHLLHATFCVKASGLPQNVIDKLNTSSGKQITFRVFVDTNFLFSILALHENPSNLAASDLQGLIATLKGTLKIALFVTPRTVDEAKHSISLAKSQLVGIPGSANFTGAALRVGISGMAERFLRERRHRNGNLSPDDWFDPYLTNFISIARGKDVELYNNNLDEYATRQDVVDDILLLVKAEEHRTSRRKTYQMIQHDMILWHFVNDKRPDYLESPIDAKDWILTVDFRLIGFDEYKQKHSNSKVPICLHPTSLIQLLQFWVPRTAEFEEAILGSLRLPFLFQGFDADAERTSLRILKGIGRFEGREELSQEAIVDVVMNEGLRARMKPEQSEEVEAQLIRDVLLEEMKTRAGAEANRAQQLEKKLQHRDASLSVLDAESKGKDEAIEQLKGRVANEEMKARQAEVRMQEQGNEIEKLTTNRQQIEDFGKRQRAQIVYIALLLAVVAVSFVVAWWIGDSLLAISALIGIGATRTLIGIVTFIFCHLILELSVARSGTISELWPFQQVSRFRRWMWSLVILSFVLGVVGNLVANQIQKNLDDRRPAPSVRPADNQSN